MADKRITPGSVLCSIVVTLIALVVLGSGPAAARPIPWEITADSLVHLDDPNSILAEGNVIMIRPKSQGPGGMYIRADWARYDVERGTVKARGNVYILSGRDEITAKRADLDLEAETGTFTESTIFMADTHMYVTGEEVEKTGEFNYTLKKGWATACKPEEGKSPPWSFTSSTTKLTLDGMAQMTNAVFHVKDAPVAYTPYMTFPAKTKRESGLLFPEWSTSSRDGLGLMVPIFLNVSPSTDITLYPGYLAKRGVQYGGEFRYVQGLDSHGTFMLNYLRDKLDDGADLAEEYKKDGLIRRETNRYWLRGKANHDFGDHLIGRLDLDLVSDQDYLQEFRDGVTGFTANNLLFLDEFGRDLQQETLRERESSVQLVKSWSNMVASAELRTRQNTAHDIRLVSDTNGDGVLEEGEYTFLSRANSPLQALPRLDFTGRVPISGTRMSAAWDSEYVNYWRSEGVGAQRLDLHPKLITFLPRGGWLEGKISGGVRETAYQLESYGDSTWEKDSFYDRQAYDFTGNMATTFLRDFDFGSAGWLEHLVRPNLLYEYLTRTQDLPNIDGSVGTAAYSESSDRATNIFDSVDRLERKNWLTWQLNNYFTLGGTKDNGDFWSRNLGQLKLLQTYDLRRENPESLGLSITDRRYDWSDLRLETAVSPTANWTVGYQTNLSMYGKNITRYELINQYRLAKEYTLGLNYRYLQDSGMVAPYFYTDLGESSHDLIGSVGARLSETVTASYYLVKSFTEDHTVESRARLVYQPACWTMELETSTTSDDQRVMLIFSLEGVGRAFRVGRDL
ncbi:LPS-assembly protein LptD [Thiovibrio frasassiensis]|uniref:LPS assembly protein LptD n=1 Tax=Thiovibrio frasassiensis TaxID=2984131 RepID=A0A9X4MNF4_9BACT|nr:LPS assembly protein LptD [Thiovibrio frasassiensis]MDG4475877.1 LPS assembly protein LptD [Thiovibrio frasassiensis]